MLKNIVIATTTAIALLGLGTATALADGDPCRHCGITSVGSATPVDTGHGVVIDCRHCAGQ
ncbi:hypothetical protein LFM09_40740 [Lentzea alba]|uniref:hypothetical protein n=1 Tax=Lentzea alba TaxID=2714351 RepID=UPI0039BEDC9A